MDFKFGKGAISGSISLMLGILCVGGVICFHFPEYFTTPELRKVYSVGLLRSVLAASIFLALFFGAVSFVLSVKKTLGFLGIALATLATLLGGSTVPVPESIHQKVYVGLDWFILDLIVVTLIFIPLEKIWRRVDQSVFRPQWRTDVLHFFFSHVLVQALSFLILTPALLLQPYFSNASIQSLILNQPIWLQFVEILLIADFTQYWIHRAFHKIPFLWRFHAIHHSSQTMDWLAGSRLHLLDIVVTRGLILIPLFVIGFDQRVLQVYLVFVAFQATFIHTNVRWRLSVLDTIIATPAFHHWHHAAEAEAIDKNFAVHVPIWDLFFGTYYMPNGQWPRKYGVLGVEYSDKYLAQLTAPFKKIPK